VTGDNFWLVAYGYARNLSGLMPSVGGPAADQRMERYFFGDCWQCLPEDAKRKLESADQIWLSSSDDSDMGAVIGYVKLAAERMFQPLVWSPEAVRSVFRSKGLPRWFHGQNCRSNEEKYATGLLQPSLALLNLVIKQVRDRRVPLEVLPCSPAEYDILASLYDDLQELNQKRNNVMHESSHTWKRDEVRPLVQKAFGIGGCKGYLREFARLHAIRAGKSGDACS